MQGYTTLKYGCFTVFIITTLVFVAKLVLLVARYSIQRVTCVLNNTMGIADHAQQVYNSLRDPIDVGYIFTVVMYAILSFLRLAEYLMLGISTWNFLVGNKKLVIKYVRTYKENKGKVTRFVCKWSIVLCLYLLLGIAVPTFGVLQELKYDKKVSVCYDHTEAIYLAYSAVNYLRYFCAFSVRMTLIITTVIIREIWEEKGEELAGRPNEDLMVENGDYKRLLADWDKTARRLYHWTKGYKETGDQVKGIVSIFNTWYIIPWVVFFVASSLDVKEILKPWNDDSTMARLYYLLYNINQLVTLIVPFLFITFINSYHHEFYKRMKKNLLHGCENANEQAFAHMQFNIEKEEDFDFVAHIPCTGIIIHVDGPLYILFLLLGLFFTVCRTLL